MASLRVISSELPPPDDASPPAAAGTAASDEFDRHNRPRLRKGLILSAIKERYPQLASFAAPPATAVTPEACDLPRLYGRVHDERMVRFLVEAWSKWEAMGPRWDVDNCLPSSSESSGAPPLVPCHSAFRRDDGTERPSLNVMGAIGYYCTDHITPIVATLAEELRQDAAVICSAVEHARSTEDGVSYAVTTHPGHHASRDCFGGYCYLNNAALCARLMQTSLETSAPIIRDDGTIASNYWDLADRLTKDIPSECRVAILDVDYHCGNGTASIFYRDPRVLFVSIHCNPDVDYPWNAGYADEVGAGEGEGTTLHIPLEPGATWEESYKPALNRALKAIAEFEAKALVVSLGLDTHEGDKVAVNRGGFKLNGKDYYEMGLCIGSHVRDMKKEGEENYPVCFVQEGGYRMDVVGRAAADVVGGCAAGARGGGLKRARSED